MPNFVDKLVLRVREKADELGQTFRSDAVAGEEALCRLVEQHWCEELPRGGVVDRPAFAVDGSIGRVNLANGAYLFVAQALFIGDRASRQPSARSSQSFEESKVEVEILRGSIPKPTVRRFADLLLQWLEVGLASEQVDRVPSGSILFLDGALYGQLPQLYPLTIEGTPYSFPEDILQAYLYLFRRCQERGIYLISVAKTSREALLSRILQMKEGLHPILDIPDSEMLYRWTRGRAGYSTPLLLGTWGFTGGSQELLRREEVRNAPAIVSFFVRLSDFDDPVRVDLPAFCVGSDKRLGEVDGELLEHQAVSQIVQMLAGDYGGLEVYNSLLYSVDREVRLRRKTMKEVYLKLIGNALGYDIKLARDERRF